MNLYYNPEKFGLTMVGEIEWSSGCYQFDMTIVLRKEDGSLAYAEDSGCSCPDPFEYVEVGELTVVTPSELQAHLEARSRDNYDGCRSAEIAELMGRAID